MFRTLLVIVRPHVSLKRVDHPAGRSMLAIRQFATSQRRAFDLPDFPDMPEAGGASWTVVPEPESSSSTGHSGLIALPSGGIAHSKNAPSEKHFTWWKPVSKAMTSMTIICVARYIYLGGERHIAVEKEIVELRKVLSELDPAKSPEERMLEVRVREVEALAKGENPAGPASRADKVKWRKSSIRKQPPLCPGKKVSQTFGLDGLASVGC
ncbi:hypothetical protein B0A48_16435 [Cryoendolithus antarcticus]|uniref:Uncharacterized protein n=1 Tax=Cryoendolithus antarcticus TaxID=1507870 RepID=A0A1V8SEW5_9PEZI|nr:hypothetical protein B0A48_16435 [Cryoendolithus antarcticus]